MILFLVEEQILESMGYFEYLGGVIEKSKSDWLALNSNFLKARKCYGCIGNILGRWGRRCKYNWNIISRCSAGYHYPWVWDMGSHCTHACGTRGSACRVFKRDIKDENKRPGGGEWVYPHNVDALWLL